jgi:hypothetical protein
MLVKIDDILMPTVNGIGCRCYKEITNREWRKFNTQKY